MVHGFDDYRIFISTPGDLEPDRDACYAAVSQVNEATAMPAKSLHRMLSQKGNPSMDNLAAIFGAIRKTLRVEIEARTVEAALGLI